MVGSLIRGTAKLEQKVEKYRMRLAQLGEEASDP
jgi:hypothetical protein